MDWCLAVQKPLLRGRVSNILSIPMRVAGVYGAPVRGAGGGGRVHGRIVMTNQKGAVDGAEHGNRSGVAMADLSGLAITMR